MIIAIDGPSGTGKSTIARKVAKKLGFTFFDTGAMYRSLAWWVIHEKIDPRNESAIAQRLSEFSFEIKAVGEDRLYLVNGVDVTSQIRTPMISSFASQISTFRVVREKMVKIQREFAQHANAVFEGRDMGTVVFPQADVKIFLTASSAVRAKRRYLELKEKQADHSLEKVQQDIEERDRTDSTRELSPLKQAEDAVLIDTSDLTVEEVVRTVIQIAKKKTRMRWTYKFCLGFARAFLRLFYRVRIYGLEHIEPGAAILAANHASNLDPPVVATSCPEEIHFLAKDTLFRPPLFGRLIRHLNAHPVSRKGSDAMTFRLILSLLGEGKKVLLFPEGQRTVDGKLQPIERGLSFIAFKAKCRIQPVYISGTYAIWPRKKKTPKLKGNIACVFGPPIEWNEFDGLERAEAETRITSRLKTALEALEKWILQRTHS